jgi:hypothetical protein
MEICQNASALQCLMYKDRLLPAFFFIMLFFINMIYSLVPEGGENTLDLSPYN